MMISDCKGNFKFDAIYFFIFFLKYEVKIVSMMQF